MGEQEKRQNESGVSFGSYRLDVGNAQLRRGAQEVKLTGKAFAVLRYFVEHPGQLATKDDLFAAAWPETVVSEATLVSCIQELRQALRDDAKKPRYIETVHRRGYRFLPPVTTQPVPGSKFQVPSQEAVASSQQSVVSGEEEENQQAKDGDTREAEGLRLQASGPPSFSPSSLQPAAYSLSQDSALSLQDVPSPAPTHSWPSKGLVLTAVLLLTGTALTVHYLSRPTLSTQDSALRTDAVPQALPLPDKPSVVVLPFVNMSGDPTQEYFSDGLTEVLTSDLSKISSLFVISSHSALTYKGKAVKVQDVSKELGVRYVLEGSALKAGEQVRITAQLIDATTGYHLWSERYDRRLIDIFALQDEITQKIVFALKVKLTKEEQERFRHAPTDNLEAYDFLLRGLGYGNRFTKEANAQARQMFEQAITLDPQYAGAYAQLGWSYWQDWSFQWNQDPQNLERALELAQKAIVLDDSLDDAHTLLSEVYWLQKKPEQAVTEAERAIALEPNNAVNYAILASDLSRLGGRMEEAIGLAEKAVRLDPRGPSAVWHWSELGVAYQLAGRIEEAITAQKQVLIRNPNFLFGYPNLAISYLLQWIWQLSPNPHTLAIPSPITAN